MKKLFSLCLALIVLTLSARAADSSPKQNGGTNNAAADELWAAMQKFDEHAPGNRVQVLEMLRQLRSALLGFEQHYPADPRHWEAKLSRLAIDSALAQAEGRPTDEEPLFALTEEIVAARMRRRSKADARVMAAEKRMELLGLADSFTNGPARAAADAAVQELRRGFFPDDERTLQSKLNRAEFDKIRDPKAAEAILHEMETNRNVQKRPRRRTSNW